MQAMQTDLLCCAVFLLITNVYKSSKHLYYLLCLLYASFRYA